MFTDFFLHMCFFLGGVHFQGIKNDSINLQLGSLPLTSQKKGALPTYKAPSQEAPRFFSKQVIICLRTISSRIRPLTAILQVKKQAQKGLWNALRTQSDLQDQYSLLSQPILAVLVKDQAALVLLGGRFWFWPPGPVVPLCNEKMLHPDSFLPKQRGLLFT